MAETAAPNLPARQGPKDLANSGRPDYLTTPELGPRGFQDMETKDLTLPRLALCQNNTRERLKSNPKHIEGLQEGQLFNTLTRRIYGDSVVVIPLFFYKSRIFFKDLDEGGGIICMAPDGKSCQLNHGGPCLHAGWIDNKPPECTEFFNYPSLVYEANIEPKKMDLVIVSLKSTGMKAAKEWNAKMRMRRADMFAGLYKISSKPDKNKAGQDYYAWVIENAETINEGWAPKEHYQEADSQYTGVYEGIKMGTIVADTEGLDTEQPGTDM